MIYRDMLRRLYEYGWIKGDRQNSLNQRCLVGSMVEENWGVNSTSCMKMEKELLELAYIILKKFPERIKYVFNEDILNKVMCVIVMQDFNDHKDTSFEDIIEILEILIKKNKVREELLCSSL